MVLELREDRRVLQQYLQWVRSGGTVHLTMMVVTRFIFHPVSIILLLPESNIAVVNVNYVVVVTA